MSSAPTGESFRRPSTDYDDVDRPILARERDQHGLTPARLRSSAFRQVFHGVHLPAQAPDDTWTRAHAALSLVGPRAVASHATAAHLWGAVVPDVPDVHLTVATAPERHTLRDITFHVCQGLEYGHHVRGVRVTSPEQTFIDLARSLSLVDLVVVGDCLVRLGHTTPDGLRETCRRSSLKGSVAARRAAAFVRDGAESAMETRVRMLMVLAGLPEPELQVPIWRDGAVAYRLDTAYRAHRLAVEYEGRHHAEDPDQWARDVARREYLDSIGWRVIVVRAEDLYRHPAQTLARIVAAMSAAGIRTAHLDPTWSRHFPGQ